MLAHMRPKLDDTNWSFVTVKDQAQAFAMMPKALGTFREEEGLSLIVPFSCAEEGGIDTVPFSRITLQVHSDLAGVGLTAAVSAALADGGIACNVVAAFHHDYLFVPKDRAQDALEILRDLSQA